MGEKAACASVDADAQKATTAAASYSACLSTTGSQLGLTEVAAMSKQRARQLLNKMAKKYIMASQHNEVTSTNVAAANELLAKLKSLLEAEGEGVKTQVAADHKKAAEIRADHKKAEAHHRGSLRTPRVSWRPLSLSRRQKPRSGKGSWMRRRLARGTTTRP